MSKINLLSLDGGGVRGVIQAVLLKEIEKRVGTPIQKLFNFYSGTSTGGIIALLLNTGSYNIDDIIEFYTGDSAKKIFKKKLINLPWDAVKYPSANIEGVLKDKFKDVLFKDMVNPTLITSYDTVSRNSMFFYSQEDKSSSYYAWEMARSTSAAETYFEPFQLNNMCLIDGGNFANDPSLFAYIEARKQFPNSEISILSIGTGSSVKAIPYQDIKKWSILSWAQNLFDIVSDGEADTVSYAMSRIDDYRSYSRFQLPLPPELSGLDNTTDKNIKSLIALTSNAIETYWSSKIDDIIKNLTY